MIESILAVNFQAHEDLKIEFDPQITTLIGPTDAGKSAILRAVRWVLLNQPTGEAFIRHGADRCSVVLKLDGKTVKRRRSRGGKANQYVFNGEVYRSMGSTTVPETIARFLNVGEDNFQGQIDPPYWFTLSGGDVSKRLNAIVNLDDIDRALASAGKKARHASATAKVSADRLKQARERRDALKWAKDFDRDLRKLEGLAADLRAIEDERDALSSAVAELDALEAREAALSLAAEAGERAVGLGREAKAAGDAARSLEADLDELARLEASLVEVPDLTDLEKKRTAADGAAADALTLEADLTELDRLGEQLCRLDAEINEALAELEKMTAGRCPVCGNKADPSQYCVPTSTLATDPRLQEARAARSGTAYKRRI